MNLNLLRMAAACAALFLMFSFVGTQTYAEAYSLTNNWFPPQAQLKQYQDAARIQSDQTIGKTAAKMLANRRQGCLRSNTMATTLVSFRKQIEFL